MQYNEFYNNNRPSHIADKWAALINQEFSDQSAAEKKLGLPLTPWIDPDKIIMEKEQINFIKGTSTRSLLTQKVYACRFTKPSNLYSHQLMCASNNWTQTYKIGKIGTSNFLLLLTFRFQKIEEAKGIREVTDRSVFQEDQQKGTGKSLADQLTSLASGAAAGLGIITKKKKKEKK